METQGKAFLNVLRTDVYLLALCIVNLLYAGLVEHSMGWWGILYDGKRRT